ncbi:MAG TPA: Y-family DNA polymerase [Candidatus Dormibacteraeota bacterium]|nr:Y-family DNA polymerase [Candidatus Dormibacteraeota bacterium]
MNKAIFALVDCNNFFVSCERLFRPDLEGQPVVVLSSNDGCAVARSNEAKALGIPMAAPAFKYRQLFERNGVVKFSANFELYGDISDRITRLLIAITPRIEVYSVDESFLDLSQLDIPDYTIWGRQLRGRIAREIGIPVSIGIATTKTLAKIATERAKREASLAGALSLINLPGQLIDNQLAAIPIQDVWGVGRRFGPQLKIESINTALALKNMPLKLAGKLMGVHGKRLVNELSGTSCYPLEGAHRVRQSVMHGRVFGEDTNQFEVLEAAIASLTTRACLRLRRDHLLAQTAVLSLSTNRHKPGFTSSNRTLQLATPSADSGLVSQQLVQILGAIYSPRASYHRANILLYNLIPENSLQTDLFGFVNTTQVRLSKARLHAFDSINLRYGKGHLRYAAEDLSRTWEPKHQLRSPRYTTAWQDLPTASLNSNT